MAPQKNYFKIFAIILFIAFVILLIRYLIKDQQTPNKELQSIPISKTKTKLSPRETESMGEHINDSNDPTDKEDSVIRRTTYFEEKIKKSEREEPPPQFKTKKEKFDYLYTRTFGASNQLNIDGKNFDYFMKARSEHLVKCFELDGGRFAFFLDGDPHISANAKVFLFDRHKGGLIAKNNGFNIYDEGSKTTYSKEGKSQELNMVYEFKAIIDHDNNYGTGKLTYRYRDHDFQVRKSWEFNCEVAD